MVERIYKADDVKKQIRIYRDVKEVIDNYGRKSLEYLGDMMLVLEYADISILSEVERNIQKHRFDYLKSYKKDFIFNSIQKRKEKDKTA